MSLKIGRRREYTYDGIIHSTEMSIRKMQNFCKTVNDKNYTIK